jgi:hypothetical protein
MPGHVRVGGSWKTVSSPSVRVGGSWKSVTAGFTRVGGAWKQWYTASVPGDYEILESAILSGSESSVIFSNLNSKYSSEYKHLQVRFSVRGNRSESNTLLQVFFNANENYNNYAWQRLAGEGASPVQTSAIDYNSIDLYGIPGATNTANVFAPGVIDILEPFNTSRNTIIKSLNGFTGSSASQIDITSGVFLSTAIISSIHFEDRFSTLAAGSRFSLYGLKG